MKYLNYLILLFTITLLFACSEKDDSTLIGEKGYIVGFDPCTISQNYRIGYVIITEDLKDTLLSYNLSDYTNKMPASVFLNSNDTLYKIPEINFQNHRNFPFFQESLRYQYPINFTYSIANEDEMSFNV